MYSSDSTPSLGTSICPSGAALKRQKTKKNNKLITWAPTIPLSSVRTGHTEKSHQARDLPGHRSLCQLVWSLLPGFCFFFFFFFFFLLWPHLQHMEVPRLGVESELQLPAYATATATPDLSRIFDLHYSSWQRRILNLLSEARDLNCNLMVPSRIRFCCAMMGAPVRSFLTLSDIPSYACTSVFVHSLAEGHMCCFQLWVLTHEAAIDF